MHKEERQIKSVQCRSTAPIMSRGIDVAYIDAVYEDGSEDEIMIGFRLEKEKELGGRERIRELASDVAFVSDIIAKSKSGDSSVSKEGRMYVV